jgi:hypothetical protein
MYRNWYQIGIVQPGYGFIYEADGVSVLVGDPTNVRKWNMWDKYISIRLRQFGKWQKWVIGFEEFA